MHPIKGYSISTGYKKAGRRWSLGYHTGVDYAAPAGTPIYAVADGTIVAARWDNSFGNYQAIDHRVGGRTYRAYYCHQSRFARKSGSVKRGEVIGYVGSTGNSTGNHLHFEVRVSPYTFTRSAIVNPSVLYNARPAASTNRMDPKAYFLGATGSHVTWLGQRLVAHGYGRFYSVGPGPNFTAADRNAVAAFQRAQGWTGRDADGLPGPETLKRLKAAPKAASIGTAHKKKYRVTASVLNGRNKPTTVGSKVLGQAKAGATFTSDRISADKKWVRSGATKRWFSLAHLAEVKTTPPGKKHQRKYEVTASGLNGRDKPTTSGSKVLSVAKKGQRFDSDLISNDGKWIRSANTRRWYSKQYLKEIKPKVVDGTTAGGGARPAPEAAGLPMLSRSTWTDTLDNRHDALDPLKVDAMTLHWPGDPRVSFDGYTQAQVAELLRAWLDFHTRVKGWRDIGYNYAVDMEGRLYDLTGDDVGAHAGTVGNTTSLGVILVVGANDKPSAKMIATVNRLFGAKKAKFPRMAKFQPHRGVPGNATECPGDHVVAAIESGAFAA